MKVTLLGKGFEIRKFYNPVSRHFPHIKFEKIILWGKCNFSCPYCKREANFLSSTGIVKTFTAPPSILFQAIDDIKPNTEMLRISGGDPAAMPLPLLQELFAYARAKGIVRSVATNMSSRKHTELFTNIEYVAGDFKAPPRYWEKVTGVSINFLPRVIENWIILLSSKVEAEMRIPVFPFTTESDLRWIVETVRPFAHDHFIIVLRNYSPVNWLDWEKVEPTRVIELAEKIAVNYEIPVLARLRWKTRTVFIKPTGEKFKVIPGEGMEVWNE